jgi:hypothetical protein
MAVDMFKVTRLVQKQIKQLIDERVNEKLAVDYIEPKEGLLILHREWQAVMTAIRSKDPQGRAALAAIELAAAAIKFVTDIGSPLEMGLESRTQYQEKQKEIALAASKHKKLVLSCDYDPLDPEDEKHASSKKSKFPRKAKKEQGEILQTEDAKLPRSRSRNIPGKGKVRAKKD